MKKLFFLSFIIFGFNCFSQNLQNYYVKPEGNSTLPNINNDNNLSQQFDKRPYSEDKRMKVGFSTGASFMAIDPGNIFTSWVAPEVSYQINSKFKLKVGTVAMYNVMSNLQNYIRTENTKSQSNRLAQYFFYAQGEYKLSDRFTVRGTTMKEFSDLSLNPHPYSLNHIGFDYKIKDNITLSADFLLSNGNSPLGLYSNPYSSNNMNSFCYSASPFNGIFSRGW